ncbi:hypothetical protein HMPREF9374_4019 [Desmospora sp. 8437]|nr:hypothetical protein HMPREF9374_4019 [Desmospora sp. 8437]
MGSSAETIAEMSYRARRQVELFFRWNEVTSECEAALRDHDEHSFFQ